MGIERKDFERMVERVVRGRERRLHQPEVVKPVIQPVVSTKELAYNPQIVTAFFAEYKIPPPRFEYYFNATTKHRFDMAWPQFLYPVALEVQGGIHVKGAHVRGAALEREWVKLRLAAERGWRVVYCSPEQLLTAEVARSLKLCLFWTPDG